MASEIRIDYKKVKSLVRRCDLSLVDLAKNLGWPKSTLYWTLHSEDPKVNSVNQIAEYFGLEIGDILTDDSSKWGGKNG